MKSKSKPLVLLSFSATVDALLRGFLRADIDLDDKTIYYFWSSRRRVMETPLETLCTELRKHLHADWRGYDRYFNEHVSVCIEEIREHVLTAETDGRVIWRGTLINDGHAVEALRELNRALIRVGLGIMEPESENRRRFNKKDVGILAVVLTNNGYLEQTLKVWHRAEPGTLEGFSIRTLPNTIGPRD